MTINLSEDEVGVKRRARDRVQKSVYYVKGECLISQVLSLTDLMAFQVLSPAILLHSPFREFQHHYKRITLFPNDVYKTYHRECFRFY